MYICICLCLCKHPPANASLVLLSSKFHQGASKMSCTILEQENSGFEKLAVVRSIPGKKTGCEIDSWQKNPSRLGSIASLLAAPFKESGKRSWRKTLTKGIGPNTSKHAMKGDPGGIDPGACFSKQWFSSLWRSKTSKSMVLRKFDSLPGIEGNSQAYPFRNVLPSTRCKIIGSRDGPNLPKKIFLVASTQIP